MGGRSRRAIPVRRSGRRSARPIRCAFNRRGWLAFRTVSVGGAGERAGRGRPGGGVGGRPAGRWGAGAAAWAGGVDGGTPGCGRPGVPGCDPCRGRRGVDWRRGTAGGGRGVLVGGRHAGRAETVRRSTRRRGTSKRLRLAGNLPLASRSRTAPRHVSPNRPARKPPRTRHRPEPARRSRTAARAEREEPRRLPARTARASSISSRNVDDGRWSSVEYFSRIEATDPPRLRLRHRRIDPPDDRLIHRRPRASSR